LQKQFFSNKFSEPLICKIERITYEFPNDLTYAYCEKYAPNSQLGIMAKIDLKYNPFPSGETAYQDEKFWT
jgi:hypothetical protein